MAETVYHIPALLDETITTLNINSRGTYADATFGGGGHSRAILECLGINGKLFGFDQDMDAFVNCPNDSRFTFVHGNFRHIKNFLEYYNAIPLDGIVADLGVSFHHFDNPERGFSFRYNAPLDMRMNRQSSITASNIINSYPIENLTQIFRIYGEIQNPSALVRTIEKERSLHPINTTGHLLSIAEKIANPRKLKKELAQIFQALRIEVNGEMRALEQFLLSTTKILKPGGRLAIITYHSLEDRMVKNFMRSGTIDGQVEKDFFGRIHTPWQQITHGAIIPTASESEKNPRSRSAKLRVAELIIPISKTDSK